MGIPWYTELMTRLNRSFCGCKVCDFCPRVVLRGVTTPADLLLLLLEIVDAPHLEDAQLAPHVRQLVSLPLLEPPPRSSLTYLEVIGIPTSRS